MASQTTLTRITPVAGAPKERRCCLKKCPNPINDQFSIFLCGNKKCTNKIHSACYASFVEKKAKAPLAQLKDTEGNNLFFCKIGCYRVGEKINEKLTNPNYTLCWNEDGPKGPDDPTNSEAILIGWLVTEGNYAKFRGNKKGEKKSQIAEQISRKISLAKVRQQRKPKDVLNKIQHFEKLFRAAYDYTQTQTGEGLKENDPKTFEEKVLRMCPYYNELFSVMASRASSKALWTNEEDDDAEEDARESDSDDEEEEEDVEVVGVSNNDANVPLIDSNSSRARSSTSNVLEDINRSIMGGVESEAATAASSGLPHDKKRPTSNKKKDMGSFFPSSVKKAKKSAKRDTTNQLFYFESMKVSQANKVAELKEIARHNRVMEQLQKSSWDEKKEHLDYKKRLVSTYLNLQKSGFDHDYIADTFPELIAVFPKELRSKYDNKNATVEGPPVEASINYEQLDDPTSDLSDS